MQTLSAIIAASNEEHSPKRAATFTEQEQTKIYNSYSLGWTGQTRVKIGGKCWELTTCKRGSGTISTHCHTVTDEGNGAVSFMMFGDNNAKENFHLNILPRGTKATEKAIREAHAAGLAAFNVKKEAGELPTATEAEKTKEAAGLPLYCMLINYGYSMSEGVAAVIGEIDAHGRQKAVTMSDYQTNHFFYIDKHTRPHSKKFGIGTYYDDDLSTYTAEEVQPYILKAEADEKAEAEARQAAAIKAEETKKYLSQFQQADVRTTTNILKRHILKTWPSVSKVEIKTDSFSGGSSMDVTYYTPVPIDSLESFIKRFQYGHFNSMEDIYESNRDKEAIILEEHILQDYKFVSARFKEAPAVEEAEAADIAPAPAGKIQIVDYSEKAIAVIGETKAIKDQLKALGGAFNFRLKCGAGWIFSKKKLEDVKALLIA
jgi:hypothetical protein